LWRAGVRDAGLRERREGAGEKGRKRKWWKQQGGGGDWVKRAAVRGASRKSDINPLGPNLDIERRRFEIGLPGSQSLLDLALPLIGDCTDSGTIRGRHAPQAFEHFAQPTLFAEDGYPHLLQNLQPGG
jgi:hypothetical protein